MQLKLKYALGSFEEQTIASEATAALMARLSDSAKHEVRVKIMNLVTPKVLEKIQRDSSESSSSADVEGHRCCHFLESTRASEEDDDSGWHFACLECQPFIPYKSAFQICRQCDYISCYNCFRKTKWTERTEVRPKDD